MGHQDIFEIHQGEWVYLTDADGPSVLATANVAQCTIFCGRAEGGFAFMFHFDLPTAPRLRTLNTFESVLRSHVTPGRLIEYHLDGGWSCLWSPRVRNLIEVFLASLQDFHFQTDEAPLPFTDKCQRFRDGQWKKGVAYDRISGAIRPFHAKVQTKRRRPIQAYLPWCELQLSRP